MNNEFNFEFSTIYREFLSQIDKEGEFLIENTGVVLYSKIDLEERNTTYQIEEWEPDFFLIGQDGDRAFFYKKIFWWYYIYEWFRSVRVVWNEEDIGKYLWIY